jgi:hypothetical protein
MKRINSSAESWGLIKHKKKNYMPTISHSHRVADKGQGQDRCGKRMVAIPMLTTTTTAFTWLKEEGSVDPLCWSIQT